MLQEMGLGGRKWVAGMMVNAVNMTGFRTEQEIYLLWVRGSLQAGLTEVRRPVLDVDAGVLDQVTRRTRAEHHHSFLCFLAVGAM